MTINTVQTWQLDWWTQTPGNDKYYGTNGGGTKWFFDLPTSWGGTTWEVTSFQRTAWTTWIQLIPHTLWVVPTFVEIVMKAGSSTDVESNWAYDGTNQSCVFKELGWGGSGTRSWIDPNDIIKLAYNLWWSNFVGNLSNITTTDIEITWSSTGWTIPGSPELYCLMKVYA